MQPIRSGRRPVESGVDSDCNSGGAATSGDRARSLDRTAAAQRPVIVWFTRRNYPRHRALDPSGLPSTFDEWLANAGYKVERTGASPARRVVIDPVRVCSVVSRCLASNPTLRRGPSSLGLLQRQRSAGRGGRTRVPIAKRGDHVADWFAGIAATSLSREYTSSSTFSLARTAISSSDGVCAMRSPT